MLFGYSSMMESNEKQTLENLKSCKDIISYLKRFVPGIIKWVFIY